VGEAGRLAKGTAPKEKARDTEARQAMIYKRGMCQLDSEGRCGKCGKRGTCGVYWYKFMWQGKVIRESTKQGNDKVARQMEAAHRTSLAKGEVGIREKKPAPILADFIDKRFEPWARATFETTSLKTWRDFYKVGIHAIKEYKPLANVTLDEITSEKAAEFAAYRQSKGRKVSTVNSSLRVLRRILGLAVEWGALQTPPKIKKLPGERHREHVVSLDEEARYLVVAREPLGSVAAVLVDTGMRPEECFRLRWEAIAWVNGRHGSLLVTHGKNGCRTTRASNDTESQEHSGKSLRKSWESHGRLGVACSYS
jgi:hypothetical protein